MNINVILRMLQVGALVNNPDATSSVLAWLKESNMKVMEVTTHGEYITVRGTASQWEELLETKFTEYVFVKDLVEWGMNGQ